MEPHPTISLETIQSQMRTLLTQDRPDGVDRDAWMGKIVDLACDPLKRLLERIDAVEQENRQLRDQVDALSGEIAEQRRLEADDDQQRRALETILSVSPTGIAVVVEPDMRIVLANDGYRATTPNPDIDPLGRRWEEIWLGEEGFQADKVLKPTIEDQASVTLERVRRRYPDGSQRTFTMHSRPITWGRQKGVVLITWETTELEDALAAAREAAFEAHRRAGEAEEGRRTLDALMDYIPEGVVITSAQDLRILYASKFAAGIVGQTRQQMEGGQFYEVMEPWKIYREGGQLSIQAVDNPAVRAARDGEVILDQELVMIEGNQPLYLLCNAGPIRDGEGRVFASVITVRDITERKRDEAHQTFLGQLGKAVVSFRTPQEVMQGISALLGEYLNVEWCFISEQDQPELHVIRHDYHRGEVSADGEYPLAMFPAPIIERLRQGKAVVISDVALDPLAATQEGQYFLRRGVRAVLAAPWLDSSAGWTGTLVVVAGEPRIWRRDEIYLVQAVADLTRLALDNVRLLDGLQQFRTRFEVALQSAPITVFTTDRDLKITWIFNPHWDLTPEPELDGLPGEFNRVVSDARFGEMERAVLEQGSGQHREFLFSDGDEITSQTVTVEPLRGHEGETVGLAVAVMDTTELRRMEAESARSHAHIEVQHRLIEEREQERISIARDLHDGPLQNLIAVNFNLVEAMDIANKEQRLNKMRTIQEMLQGQIRELRRFCNELRPPALAPFGLEKTIRSHVESLRELYPWLKVRLRLQRDGQALPEDVRMVLFRIYQELMTNIIRHAQADRATVHFSMEDAQIILEVEDNGVGFASELDWVEMARSGHLGLVGAQERVEMAGGELTIDSQPDVGTRVRVSLPRQRA